MVTASNPKLRKKVKAKAVAKKQPRAAGGNAFAADRERLDKKKIPYQRKMQWAFFWLLCPKCGGDMFEQTVDGIRFEACRDCNGIYIDHAEVTLLLQHKDAGKTVKSLHTRAKKPKVPK